MISDVAQRMISDAARLKDLAGGGVQDNEQADVSKIFSNILNSAGQSGAQWSEGERIRLIKGALDYVGADQNPAAQGDALKDFSKLVKKLASDDTVGGGTDKPNGDCGCGGSKPANDSSSSQPSDSSSSGEPFKVSGNTVDTGKYCITASNEESGRLEVTDKQTGQKFKVWGDPHIETGDGDKTDFHRKPATFELPDGTKITIDPTDGEGATFIEKVAITRGDQAVEMTGFRGNLQTQEKTGQGAALDQQYEDGTVMKTKNGEIDDLVLPDGQEITGNNIKDIDKYAGTGAGGGANATDKKMLDDVSKLIDQLGLSAEEKDALKSVVSLLGRLLNNAGAPEQGQPSKAATEMPKEKPVTETPAGGEQQGAGKADGGPFGQIMSALTALIDKLNLPAGEKDALKTVLSLIGRLVGGGDGQNAKAAQEAA